MTNAEIAQRWANGRYGKNRSMFTDGRRLFSYGLRIGVTRGVGRHARKVVYDYRGRVSGTTSQHVRIACGVACMVVEPPRGGKKGR